MKQLHFHSEAAAEAECAFDWYWDRSQIAALGFDAELRAAYDSLRTSPGSGSTFLHGTRRILLNHFPFFVVFRERLHDLQIIAVAHAKRRPGYWAKRL